MSVLSGITVANLLNRELTHLDSGTNACDVTGYHDLGDGERCTLEYSPYYDPYHGKPHTKPAAKLLANKEGEDASRECSEVVD
jgi:hypothetical protein